jgi:hypothetical protein
MKRHEANSRSIEIVRRSKKLFPNETANSQSDRKERRNFEASAPLSCTYSTRNLTVSFGIDVQLGRGHRLFADPVVGDTLEDTVVALGFDGFDAQHGTVWHVHRNVSITSGRDSLAAFSPEYFRRRIAGRLAKEADGAAVNDDLVARRQRYLWSICKAKTICIAFNVAVYSFDFPVRIRRPRRLCVCVSGFSRRSTGSSE